MRYIPKYQRSGVLQKLNQAEDTRLTINNPIDISKIIAVAGKEKESGTISNETKSNLEKDVITIGTKIIKKLDRDILPPLALAGMIFPVTRMASQAYLVNKLENNNINAEAVNTAYSRAKNNYISEAAGGLVDAKQSWEELKKGNFLYKDGKFGAIPQAIWAISGVVEPTSGIPNRIDNFIEKSKAVGDFADITIPAVDKVINPLYSEVLKIYTDSKNPKKQLAQEKTVKNHKKGGVLEALIVKNQKGKTLPKLLHKPYSNFIKDKVNSLQDGGKLNNTQEILNIIKEVWKK